MGKDIQNNLSYQFLVTKEAFPFCRDFLNQKNYKFNIINDEADVKSSSKRNIIFQLKKGRFIEPCPGTPNYICCGYYIISPVENCPFDCSYCILQAYFKDKNIRVYVNTGDMIKELEKIKENQIFRFGTGEFSDSLFLPVAEYYLEKLLDFFSEHENLYLELKTKSHIIPKAALNYIKRNLIFSFSLNSPTVWRNEELHTSSVIDRISKAKLLAEKGYLLSFHFDPIIEYEKWHEDYKKTIDYLFDNISESKIVWISMGTLRYMPSLKDIAQINHPNTNIFRHEFIIGLDGKKRYFRKSRVEIYKKMLSMIKERAEKVFVYLCMENADVWMDVFGIRMTSKKLKKLMDEQILK